MSREQVLTKALKRHDSDLYAKRLDNKIVIYRKSQRYDVMWLDEGQYLLFSRPQDEFVFPLTDDFKITGNPVEWGIEPIIARLKAIDLQHNEEIFEDLMDSYEKQEKSNRRNFRNNVESFLYDFRSDFKKATSDINTSLLRKDIRRSNGTRKS